MIMRMPAYPLVTIDPYFSIWSPADNLNDKQTVQWTGMQTRLIGTAVVGGEEFVFMGVKKDAKKAEQLTVNCTALSTEYLFSCGKSKFSVKFTSPVLVDDIMTASRPVSYIYVETDSDEPIRIKIAVSEQICLEGAGQHPVNIELPQAKYPTIKMGSSIQDVLGKSGDVIHIDYGYFYLTAVNGSVGSFVSNDMSYVFGEATIKKSNDKLFCLAYDDIYSVIYFGERLKSLWNFDGTDIITAITNAVNEYNDLMVRCDAFDKKLYKDATRCGGEIYADLLSGAYRQVMAGHKPVKTSKGEILFISKECSSNGCAATVDITYPSAPIFLLYNPELIRGMLRPVFDYAESDAWKYDFAPHDEGTYPILNGQTYHKCKREYQMPVEECGNMLLICSSLVLLNHDTDFVLSHKATLDIWANYLVKCGYDPENQLCTDDFAGHLSHNCNLSLKAICALGAYAKVCKFLNDNSAKEYEETAKDMASKWIKAAKNSDGSTRLAFDKENTFSLKYNMVWDKLLELGLFGDKIFKAECETYKKLSKRYGTPLDSRESYTKSDWLMWCAVLNDSTESFTDAIKPLWDFYNETPDRVPMSDWYDTESGKMCMFKHRTVQGALWMKMLNCFKEQI